MTSYKLLDSPQQIHKYCTSTPMPKAPKRLYVICKNNILTLVFWNWKRRMHESVVKTSTLCVNPWNCQT